jgi:ABC-2 type transport system permease protein
MFSSLFAESLKLRKRPATWVLALVWITLVAMFGYFFTYAFVANAPGPSQDQPREMREQQEQINEQLLDLLLPENVLENLFVNGAFNLGVAVVLILGALAAGSEYGWGTLKTSLTQRPGKLGVLAGKVLAVTVAFVLFALLGLATGALSSLAVARLEGAAVDWPSTEQFLKAAGAGALAFGAWGFFGFALAVAFRGTALAIGLGLAWALAVENVIAFLPIRSDAYEEFRRFTLGENTASLGSIFGEPNPAFGIPEPLVEPERAAITLAVYAAVFVLVSTLFFLRRDVT